MIRKENLKNVNAGICILLFGMTIVTHFFTFLCLKQTGTGYLQLSGFDLIFGKGTVDSIGFQTDYLPDLWLEIAFFLTVCGLVFSLLRLPGYEIQILLASLGALVCLSLFIVKMEYRVILGTICHFSIMYWVQMAIFGILVCISFADRLINTKPTKNTAESKTLNINIITKNSQNFEDV